MDLVEARKVLMDSVLHADANAFDVDKQDRALRVSFERFMRETKIARTVGSVTIANAATTLDVTATLTDFRPECLTSAPYISAENVQLQVVSFDCLLTRKNTSGTTSGTPELIAWLSPSLGHLFPTADAQYTLSVPYWQPFTAFTPGTKTNPTLNVPDRWAYDVIWSGARGALLRGAPGHEDWRAADEQFERLIQEARGSVSPPGVWFIDQNNGYDQVYTYRGFV